MPLTPEQIDTLRILVEAAVWPDNVNLSWLRAALAVEFPTLRGERQDDAVIRHLTQPAPKLSARSTLVWFEDEDTAVIHLCHLGKLSWVQAPYTAWMSNRPPEISAYEAMGARTRRGYPVDTGESRADTLAKLAAMAEEDGYTVPPIPPHLLTLP